MSLKKSFVFLISLFIFVPSLFALAQEEPIISQETTPPELESEIQSEIQKEESVLPEDLEVKEPRVLPDSPFYFAKNWWRAIRLVFVFDPLKKAQLRERFANEKLIELQKLAQKTKDAKVLEKAKKNYEKEIEALRRLTERVKKVKNKPKIESFLDKFIRHQILHQRLLEKIEKQVPPQASEKIREAREKHLERFREVMLKLEEKKKIPERLEKAITKIRGSRFKEIKALEILKRIEEKIDDPEAKEAVQKARERIIKKIEGKITKLPPQRKMILRGFIEELPGDKEKHLEIIEDLKEQIKENPQLKEELEKTREKLLERIVERKKEILKKRNCPIPLPPTEGFCKEGRVVIIKDKKGCPRFVCLTREEVIKEEAIKEKEEIKVCPQIWDPVCGKNGKTYSNRCFAKIANVEIAHQGVCENILQKCAREGERVNRNPFLGPTNRVCCPGLVEDRVSRSYSICRKPENVIQIFQGECKEDKDCPQPKCPGLRARCVEGKCLIPKCGPAEELFPKKPGRIVVCCLPGEICARMSQEVCGWSDGKVVEAESCHPNPCRKEETPQEKRKRRVPPLRPEKETLPSPPPLGE